MKSITATRALLLSAVAGAGVVGGVLFFGAGIVSADDPTPTPAPSQQQTPQGQTPGMPGSGRQGAHNSADCPNMGNDSDGSAPSSSGPGTNGEGTGFRMQQRGPRA